MFLAGASNYALGRLEAAHWNLQRVLARQPAHIPARQLLAATDQLLDLARSDPVAALDADERLFRVDAAVVPSVDAGDAGVAEEGADPAAAGRLARAGDHTGAARILARLQRALPDDAAVLELAGGLALLAGRPQLAADSFEAALERRPSAALARKLALAQWQAGERAGSEATLEAWLGRAPDDLETRLTLAELYLAANQPAAARRHLVKAVMARPADATVLNNLAWALLEEGQANAARPYAERAVAAAPHEPRAMDTLALVLTELGRLDRAIELLEQASRAETADPAIEAHLAQALARRGHQERAREILRRLLAESPALSERDQAEAEALLQDLGG
jgi:Tfp pilus assembly protein PilF